MKLAAGAGFGPRPGALDRNAQVIRQLCVEAASWGARVVVFPELALSGRPQTLREAVDMSQQRDNTYVDMLAETCAQHGCYVAFGFVELAYGRLYNSAALVGPQGLLASARKKNLTGNDFVWANEGTLTHPSVVTPLGRVGLVIGTDARNTLLETHPKADGQRFYPQGSIDIACVMADSPGSDAMTEWVHLAQSLAGNAVVGNVEPTGMSCVIGDGRTWVADDRGVFCIVGGYLR